MESSKSDKIRSDTRPLTSPNLRRLDSAEQIPPCHYELVRAKSWANSGTSPVPHCSFASELAAKPVREGLKAFQSADRELLTSSPRLAANKSANDGTHNVNGERTTSLISWVFLASPG
jgi:hypothetical protein